MENTDFEVFLEIQLLNYNMIGIPCGGPLLVAGETSCPHRQYIQR